MTVNPADIFTAERSDLSNFLVHLTKNGSYELYEPYPWKQGHFQWKDSDNLQADDSLKKILDQALPTLEARAPFGHFKFDISVYSKIRRAVPLDWLKCVCFSETPLRELKSFYQATQLEQNQSIKKNKYKKFGLGFFTAHMRQRSVHPVFYFDSKNESIYKSVDRLADAEFLNTSRPILPLFESFGPPRKSKTCKTKDIDFRWEREWRHVGIFTFDLSEVAFGLCPEDRITEFELLAKGKFPFFDPDWSVEELHEYLVFKNRKDLAEAL